MTDIINQITNLIPTIVFYMFAFTVLFSGAMVILSKNPVHSVFFLILAFFNAAGLFLLIGAEYLAMTLIIVYVGAVAVLFLFVVMMLDINFVELRQGFMKYLPVGVVVAGVLFAELIMVIKASLSDPSRLADARQIIPAAQDVTNTHAIGQVMYTWYLYPFQMSGIILLIAMIGAIVLTLRVRAGVRKQNVSAQLARKREDSVAIVKVESGKGI